MPRVSIMIPTYNYGHFLGEAIQSVLDQTFQDFEIIVVDDGSTDNTKEVVSNFKDPRIRYIYQEHRGASAAQNVAIRASKGEYFTGLGADDLYLPRNLELKVKLLDSRPDVGMVCSDALSIDGHTGAIYNGLWHGPGAQYSDFNPVRAVEQPLKELIHDGCIFLVQASLIRRQVFDVIGYFDETLPSSEDWDLVIRIVQHFRIEIIDTVLVKLRRHSANLSVDPEKMYLGAVAFTNKVIRTAPLSREEIRFLKEKLLPLHIQVGQEALLSGREAAARKALLAGIKLAPWKNKLYVLFVLSFLGTRKILALKNWRKKLRRHTARRKSLEGVSSIGG
jgi:glycosyltransferase involved in cell wall biosynthesis